MRQRRLKNIEEKRKQCAAYIVEDAAKYKGKWNEAFPKAQDLYMELGCGKGAFISRLARQEKDNNYIGIEAQESVMIRAGLKLLEEGLDNALIVNEYIKEITEYFDDTELSGMYLNFSDPWPKKRHAKRRLTHRNFLAKYKQIVKPGGFLKFKTDDNGLFEFTFEEVEALGLNVKEISTNLHGSQYKDENIMTEYEEKFSLQGKNIYYLKIEF